MNNELITEKKWWNRNWKWFVPFSGFIIICLLIISNHNGSNLDFAKAYTDTTLCQNAINKANQNEAVIKKLGKLEPIDKLAILEGNAKYSNDNKFVEITVRVNSNKEKAKMDISAEKDGQKWKYKNIRLRIIKTEEEIQIVN
jgi:hypothetical protein